MLKKNVLVMVVLCGLSGVLSAAVALNQDFEGLTLGSLGTTGQGSTSDVGGKWFAANAAADPSIVQDPYDPNNNQCARITGGQAMLAGYSTAAPIAAGTPFILSFSVYPRDLENGLEVGSFTLTCDSISTLSPSSKGISMFNYTVGPVAIYDGTAGHERLLQLDLYPAKNTWVDIKIHVKTWNDGTGYGRYDTWYNNNANSGPGWVRVDVDNPFVASDLHDGVNAVLIRPRLPNVGILDYFDNVSLTTEPLDCTDAMIFSGTVFSEADFNRDCSVDMSDLGLFTHNWLRQPEDIAVSWQYRWDCNELPDDAMGGAFLELLDSSGYAIAEVNDGIFTGSTMGGLSYALLHRTRLDMGIYDAGLPAMVEFRVKMVEVALYETAALVFWDGTQGGYVGTFFRPGKYYEDVEGWTTYRAVTILDEDGNIKWLELYYQDADGRWVMGHIALTLINAGVDHDEVYFGDPGGEHDYEGTWQEDYFYLTQDQPSIERFLADMAVQAKDLNGDGMVNLVDFSTLSAEWLQSLSY